MKKSKPIDKASTGVYWIMVRLMCSVGTFAASNAAGTDSDTGSGTDSGSNIETMSAKALDIIKQIMSPSSSSGTSTGSTGTTSSTVTGSDMVLMGEEGLLVLAKVGRALQTSKLDPNGPWTDAALGVFETSFDKWIDLLGELLQQQQQDILSQTTTITQALPAAPTPTWRKFEKLLLEKASSMPSLSGGFSLSKWNLVMDELASLVSSEEINHLMCRMSTQANKS
jgi:hypothetical protein